MVKQEIRLVTSFVTDETTSLFLPLSATDDTTANVDEAHYKEKENGSISKTIHILESQLFELKHWLALTGHLTVYLTLSFSVIQVPVT